MYRDVLSAIGVPVVPYYGSYLDEATDQQWLFIEYLDGVSRVHETVDPAAALDKAACWLGQFHSAGEDLLRRGTMARLNAYDHDYYAGWSRRTLDFAEPWLPQFPWLPNLCNRFTEVIPTLLAGPASIIHGEFYPKNILVRGEDVRPVDWESAAVARGEIDLASLTDGWPLEFVSRCEQTYVESRFPRSAPDDFSRMLSAARVYLHLRWLGNKRDETVRPERRRRFELLHDDGLRLGLI